MAIDSVSHLFLLSTSFCVSVSMLVYLPYPDLVITTPNCFYGTDGYFAPETLKHFDYSYKTDIW